MLAAPLCRCICGNTRKGDPLDHHLDAFTEVEEATLQQTQNTGLLSYCDAADQPMRGLPIREGQLWLLSAEEEVEPITLSLYINGLSFTHHGREVSISFSPFSLVRNCKFQSSSLGGTELSAFKCFKVSLFTQGVCFYFGVQGETGQKQAEQDSENERSRWVLDVSRAMRLVTQSLFPVHNIVCGPVKSASSTHRRLMAGYLVHHDGGAIASVLYCEMHPQSSRGTAKLALYEDESCQELIFELLITERSCCCEKVGINCSCFSIEDHQFSSRTLAERRLWLRAISNLKVKLQNRAPSPSDEELQHYRLAIQEHVKAEGAAPSQAPMDALLQRYSTEKAYNNAVKPPTSPTSQRVTPRDLGSFAGMANATAAGLAGELGPVVDDSPAPPEAVPRSAAPLAAVRATGTPGRVVPPWPEAGLLHPPMAEADGAGGFGAGDQQCFAGVGGDGPLAESTGYTETVPPQTPTDVIERSAETLEKLTAERLSPAGAAGDLGDTPEGPAETPHDE